MLIVVRHEKKYRIRRRVATSVVVLLAGMGLGLLSLVVMPLPDGTPEGALCEEDMPCWDCETMGNGECGGVDKRVVTVNGHSYVVTGSGVILGEITEP